MVHPIHCWFKPQSERGDDAIGALSVVHFLNVCTMQFNDLRRFFKRDHANHGDVACVFKYAAAHAARTCVAACNKAANGGDVSRARAHQNFLPAG